MTSQLLYGPQYQPAEQEGAVVMWEYCRLKVLPAGGWVRAVVIWLI